MMHGLFASCTVAALLLAAAWADHQHGHQDHQDQGLHLGHQHGQGHQDQGLHLGHQHGQGHQRGKGRGRGHKYGHHRGHHHGHHDGHHHGEEILVAPNAEFAFALYKSLNAKAAAGKNIFFSPLGISMALSMLSTGAGAETHKQLFSTLGYGHLQQTQVNEAYKHLLHMLDHSQNQELGVANGLALRAGFTPLAPFLKSVDEEYSGEIFEVDPTKPGEAEAEINSFIANQTNNKITDQVKDLDPDMAMVLINSVYFQGQWMRPFDGADTKKEDFTVDENTKVQVDMMKRSGRYDMCYDDSNHTMVVMVPYKGNTSMMIVLPDEGKMKEVEGIINKDLIHHWHDSLFLRSVHLSMPKFTVKTSVTLVDTLQEMGITDAFGDAADFSGISDTKLKVSGASHEAFLSVDEKGTEAAGGTTLSLTPWSIPTIIKLNRPFLVFILEHSTKSILFMGKINNPSEV